MPDLAQAYAEIRRGLTDTLLGLDPEAWTTPIATRPEWNVKDVVAMLTGFAHAMVEGRWTEDYSDSWRCTPASTPGSPPAARSPWARSCSSGRASPAVWSG